MSEQTRIFASLKRMIATWMKTLQIRSWPNSKKSGRASTTSMPLLSTFWPRASSARSVWVARLRAKALEADLDPAFAEKFLTFIIDEVIRHHVELRED